MKTNIDDKVLVKLQTKLEGLNDNKQVKLAVHQQFRLRLLPYEPMRIGIMSERVAVTEDYLHYLSPQSHYMHEGVVYGPNIPIFEDGVIVGYFSLPGRKKQPTGEKLKYFTDKHPKATHHWEQAMMQDEGDAFEADVKNIVTHYLKKGAK